MKTGKTDPDSSIYSYDQMNSEEKWRTLVTNAPDIITIVDREAKVLFTNRSIPEYDYHKVLGTTIYDFISKDSLLISRDSIKRAFENGELITHEAKGIEDVNPSWYMSRVGPVHDKGKIVAVMIVSTDITEKKQMEDSLRESEENFRALAENANDGILISSGEGKHVYANQRAAEITGYSIDELLQTDIKDLTHPDEFEKVSQIYLKRLAGEIVPKQYETFIIGKPGEVIPIEVTASRTMWHGQPAVLVILRDISDRKMAEKQLQRYSEELEDMVEERTARIRDLERQRTESEKLAATGRMAARIAHEINNPLAGIKNSFLLLKSDFPKDHTYYEYLELIDKEIHRVSQIIHRMFDLYRPFYEPAQEFILSQSIGDIVSLLAGSCNEYGVSIETDISGVSGPVNMREVMFRQILYNLVQNAIEASSPGGIISISTKLDEEGLILTVADQGQGIPENAQARIFEPFFTTKSDMVTGGMGLGLSIIKGILDSMNGSIDFESKAGQGTIFRIVIPLEGK